MSQVADSGAAKPKPDAESALRLLAKQRSHMLVALTNPKSNSQACYVEWYRDTVGASADRAPGVLCSQLYEQHDVDVSVGRYPRLPYRYLALYELSVDGAEAAAGALECIANLHRLSNVSEAPALWLYYAISERVGRSAAVTPSTLTLAFANAIPGREPEFREWYSTRHIRHALKVSGLVSGQCFERTQFQWHQGPAPAFTTIAIYEQEGTPEAMIKSFATLPAGALAFPAMDLSRFAEWVYRPV